MVAKAGERASGLDSLEFGDRVDAVFENWADEVGRDAS
jgi:hypothetical protein